MPKYIKPEFKSLVSDSFMELAGPAVTAGYLNIGAARNPSVTELIGQKQIVICKTITPQDTNIVKIS
jgi:hypothetical protein